MKFNDFSVINLEEFSSKKLILPALPLRYLDLEFLDDQKTFTVEESDYVVSFPFAKSDIFTAVIKDTKVLVGGDDVKKVIEITFDISETKENFLPGDTIAILTENHDEEVNFVIDSLNLTTEAQKPCLITVLAGTQKKNAKLPNYIPPKSTIRTILKKYLNIRSPPKKLFIRALAEFASDDHDRRLLEVLCSKDGSQLYTTCLSDKQLTFLDLLKLCPSLRPPFGVLIEHLPRLLPRSYSIANSPLKSNQEIKIAFSLLEGPKVGLTTNRLETLSQSFLNNKNEPHTVELYFRQSNGFKYSEEIFANNIIMIGIGCGVSPFMGFIEHRAELMKLRIHETPGIAWLFTGSRYRNNAVYGAEIKEYTAKGVITEVFESFSRESDSEYKYVQDQIKANSVNFVNLLLQEDTLLYVCADGANVSSQIAAEIVECIKTVCSISLDDANDIVKNYRKQLKYIEDIWQ